MTPTEAPRTLAASGVYMSAETGGANFSLSPDELGEADVEIFRDSGDVILSVESSSTDTDSAGCLVVLSDEEAIALGEQLVEEGESQNE